jgi:thiamine-phosphate pyrophosphorylase
MKPIGRLHILTDTVLQKRFSHIELTSFAVSGGADTIQFRQKQGSTREMIETAREMKRLCAESGVAFIVNDRIDVAIASGADGVHLGQDDFPVALARELLGDNKIIGGSAATMDEARKCFSEGVDYIGFGPVYNTTSKHDAGPVSGLEVLEQVVGEIPLPIVVIGGIDADNASAVMKAGAYGVAVISSVCCQDDPEKATIKLSEAVNGNV